MYENLKECPFCGSKSVRLSHKQADYLGENDIGVKKIKKHVRAICNKCLSRGKPIAYIRYKNCTYGQIQQNADAREEAEQQAIREWNNRPIRTQADRIRNMSNDELAELMCDISYLADNKENRLTHEQYQEFHKTIKAYLEQEIEE